jgi:hypothetical protein
LDFLKLANFQTLRYYKYFHEKIDNLKSISKSAPVEKFGLNRVWRNCINAVIIFLIFLISIIKEYFNYSIIKKGDFLFKRAER